MTVPWMPRRLPALLAGAMLAAWLLPTAGATLSVQLSPAGPVTLTAGSPTLLSTPVQATASGGTAPYAYTWTRTSGSQSSITNPASGSPSIGAVVNWGDHFAETWTVTATDATGATGTVSLDVSFNAPSADGVPDSANRVPIAGTVTQYRLTTALPVGQATYPIQVYVPADYAATSEPLPVIYATDAGPRADGAFAVCWEFFDLVRIIEARHLRMVVVGIGGNETRDTDFLLPGANAYYQFLTTEIIPFVEARYDVDRATRTLSGHSYGGLFCGMVFLRERPGTRFFANYIALDGSFWVYPAQIIAMEQALDDATDGALPDTALVLSSATGGNDGWVTLFYQQLSAYAFRGLQLSRIPNFNTGHLLMYDEAVAASIDVVSANLPGAWTPPAITTQPQGTTVDVGSAIRLQVTAVGGGLAYEWRRNGVAIPGATGPTFSVPFAAATDGGTYTVTVSNRLGSVASDPVTVAVTTPTPPPSPAPSSGGGGGGGAPSLAFLLALAVLALARRACRGG